jgi:hypothetical protein
VITSAITGWVGVAQANVGSWMLMIPFVAKPSAGVGIQPSEESDRWRDAGFAASVAGLSARRAPRFRESPSKRRQLSVVRDRRVAIQKLLSRWLRAGIAKQRSQRRVVLHLFDEPVTFRAVASVECLPDGTKGRMNVGRHRRNACPSLEPLYSVPTFRLIIIPRPERQETGEVVDTLATDGDPQCLRLAAAGLDGSTVP